MRNEFPEFEITSDGPVYFTGEMVGPETNGEPRD